jgi:hypothetical protein
MAQAQATQAIPTQLPLNQFFKRRSNQPLSARKSSFKIGLCHKHSKGRERVRDLPRANHVDHGLKRNEVGTYQLKWVDKVSRFDDRMNIKRHKKRYPIPLNTHGLG